MKNILFSEYEKNKIKIIKRIKINDFGIRDGFTYTAYFSDNCMNPNYSTESSTEEEAINKLFDYLNNMMKLMNQAKRDMEYFKNCEQKNKKIDFQEMYY